MNKYAPKRIDKIEAQELYDSGFSIRNLAKHYNVAKQTIVNLKLTTRTNAEANKLAAKTKVFSEKGLKNLSLSAKRNKLGGYRPHPNKGIWYKEIWFDSKYELKVAMSLDEHNIKWSRPTIGFLWSDDGKRYYPDFYLIDFNVYLDPKNDYLILKDKLKINEAQKRNNIKVIVLDKNNLEWNKIHALVV